MKRRIDISLRSLGSGYENDPDPGDLAKWIATRKGSRCDLISYRLEKSLLAQRSVDFPCTGGKYYSGRLSESIGGLKDGNLVSEPYPVPEDISLDAGRVRKIRKGCRIALPPPSALGISDYYFDDRQDFISALCEVYRKIMREQRDRGVDGHIFVADYFSSIEMEELSGSKAFFFSPEGKAKVLSSILEFQEGIAVFPGKIDVLFELMPEYEVKAVTVIDPGREDLEKVQTEFDPGYISTGGFCRGCGTEYWDSLKENSFLMV